VIGECLLDDATHLHCVRDIELAHPEAVVVNGGEVIQMLRMAQGRSDAIPASERLFGQFAANATGRTGDKPC